MSAGNDFAAGASLFNSVWDRAEAAKENRRKAEWEDYVRGREREFNTRFDKAYADVNSQLDQAAGSTEFDASKRFGMQGPTPEERMKLGYAQYGASQSPTYDNATDGAQFTPQAKPTTLSYGKDYADQMKMLKAQLGLAKTGAEINTVMTSMRDLKRNAERASIESHVLSLDNDSLDRLVKGVSDDPQNGYEAVKQPNGTYLVSLNKGTPVKMTKTQIAKMMGAHHALDNGDRTAIEDIAKIDENLAAQVATQFSRAKDMATVGNQAFTAASTDAYHKGSLGLQRERAAAQEGRERMGAVQYFQDPKTQEIKAYIPSVGKNGVVWNEVQTPTGMRPYRAGQKDIPEADIDAIINNLKADPRFKATPYEVLREKAIAIRSGQSGGLANPYAAGPQGAAAPATEAPAAKKPVYNPVGYPDVDSTIEGARNNPQARAYLKELIDSGQTNPRQRQRIAELFGEL